MTGTDHTRPGPCTNGPFVRRQRACVSQAGKGDPWFDTTGRAPARPAPTSTGSSGSQAADPRPGRDQRTPRPKRRIGRSRGTGRVS